MHRLLSSRENGPPKPQFNTVSDKCRNQIISIVYRAIYDAGLEDPAWFCDMIRLNLGLEPIPINTFRGWDELKEIASELNDSEFKDFIDLMCQIFNEIYMSDKDLDYEEFTKDVNCIMKQNGLGYKCLEGTLTKIFDEVEYQEITVPCFETLDRCGLKTPEKYLKNAFECFKKGNNSGALVDSVKALESTVDTIADKLAISIDKNDKLNNKIKKLEINKIYPTYEESFLNALVKLLSEASARNNLGAHAKNDDDVDDHLVQYALNQTMSSILFLARSFETYRPQINGKPDEQ